jgi:hypothetical protein
MEKRYDSEIFQILHYFNSYLDNKSKVELRKAEVWVSLMKKSIDELELFSEFYVPDFYRSILWRLLNEQIIELTGTQVSLIECVHAKRRVSTYDDYVKLANMLSALYVQLSES